VAGRKLTVKVDADPKPYQRGLKQVERDTRSWSGRMKGHFGSLKSGAAGILAAAGGAIIALGGTLREAAQDADQTVLLADALTRVAGATEEVNAAVEDWITNTSIASGVADSDLRPALLRLATVTGEVESAQKLLTLAMDISAQTGAPLESVSKALGKAYKGQTGPLGKLTGLTFTAGENAGAWSRNQKLLNDKFGGAAQKKADTYTGTVDRLGVAFSEVVENLGTSLLPLLEDFADYLSSPEGKRDMASFIKATENLGKTLGTIGDSLDDIRRSADSMPDWLREVLIKGFTNPIWNPGGWSNVPGFGRSGATAQRMSPSGYGGPTIVVQGAVDPQATARTVQRMVQRADVRAGRQRLL
jgi:hypothetical protein